MQNAQNIGRVALCGGERVIGGGECSGAANACWCERRADGQVDSEGGLLWDAALFSVGAQGRRRKAHGEVGGGQAGGERHWKRGAFCCKGRTRNGGMHGDDQRWHDFRNNCAQRCGRPRASRHSFVYCDHGAGAESRCAATA